MWSLTRTMIVTGLLLLIFPFCVHSMDSPSHSSRSEKEEPSPEVERNINFQAPPGRTPRIYNQQKASQQAPMDILSANWSVAAEPSVAEMSLDKRAITTFENHFADDPENPIKLEQIGDFKWVDIDKDGIYELLTTTAASRAFYNSLAIYKSVADKKIQLQLIGVWMLSNLDEAVKDLDGDGTPELLLPMLLSEYRGARPMPIWTSVYQWNGQKFEDASHQFREFYQQRVLPDLEREIQKLSVPLPVDATDTARGGREEQLAAAWVVRDKIARVLGDDPYAGVERAQKWMKSPNEHLRADALVVFEDIENGYFKTEFQILATDPYPSVANGAKLALERLEKKRQP